ncbi:MAG: hypothetical protein WC492_00685 [Candidatus Micrarchaeia archaeon]
MGSIGGSVLLRWVLLLAMALCLAVLLDNQDKNMRMVAVVFLVVLAQIREVSLIEDATAPVSKQAPKTK